MPVTVAIDSAAAIVRVTYTEPFTFDEWLVGAAQFRSDREAPFNKDFSLLIDRTAIGDLPTTFMSNVVSHVAAIARMVRRRRVAIVVQPGAMPNAMLQAMMYEEMGATAAVFNSMDEAHAWLAEREPR